MSLKIVLLQGWSGRAFAYLSLTHSLPFSFSAYWTCVINAWQVSSHCVPRLYWQHINLSGCQLLCSTWALGTESLQWSQISENWFSFAKFSIQKNSIYREQMKRTTRKPMEIIHIYNLRLNKGKRCPILRLRKISTLIFVIYDDGGPPVSKVVDLGGPNRKLCRSAAGHVT